MIRPDLLCLLSLLIGLPAQDPAAGGATGTTVRLTGRAVTFDGAPIAGAAVLCAAPDDVVTAAFLEAPQATTDETGAFALEATPPSKGSAALYLHVAKKGMASVARYVRWRTEEQPAAEDGEPVYAAETAFGDVVLTEGQQLFGRVRDATGKALGGVRVVARDLLEQGSVFRSGTTHGFQCSAVSRDSGIFHLPCALPAGAVLEFSAEGYGREWLQPVAAGTPLEVTLRETGWVQGRVLDAEGRSIEGAKVTIAYELRAGGGSATTGADGAFRLPLDRPGRYRITAATSSAGTGAAGHSAVLLAPQENLEILVETKAAATEHATLAVRAVTREGEKVVPAFRAVSLWEDYANRNTAYREYRFRYQLQREGVTAEDGVAKVRGPGENSARVGAVRVIAEGFAPATVTEHEWQEVEEGKEPEPLVVPLDPESTVAGVVRDEQSGEPVAGAKVWADLKPRPNESYYGSRDPQAGTMTGADGRFVLRGLGEGEWQLFVEEPGHPKVPPTDVTLATAQALEGITVTLPSGAVVAGSLEGIELGSGARVFLAPQPKQVFGDTGPRYGGRSVVQALDDRTVPVEADGSFRFAGVPLDNHLLVVRLPSLPRLGGDLYLPIEPFRVRAAGIDRRFDCSQDQPGRIQGRISFSHADLPLENLVVVAQVVVDDSVPMYFSPYNQSYPGPRAFVGRDGTFELRVGPGNYRLQVVDLMTTVLLHAEEKSLAVAAGKVVERDLVLRLARIDLELAPAAGTAELADVERVEVRFVTKAMKDQAKALGGNDQYDSRSGMWWGHGTTQKSIALPEGTAVFLGRNEIAQLRIDKQRSQNAPLGRAELEVSLESGAVQSCRIEVVAPPPIPDADGAIEQDGDAAADGVEARAAGQVQLRK